MRATLHGGMRRNKLLRFFASITSGGDDVSQGPWVVFSREHPEDKLRMLSPGFGGWRLCLRGASGCCRRFLDSPPEVCRRFLLMPQAVNFRWCQFLHGGSAEFLSYRLRKIRRAVKHNWVCVPGNLRGSWVAASGASVILKIWILSRV